MVGHVMVRCGGVGGYSRWWCHNWKCHGDAVEDEDDGGIGGRPLALLLVKLVGACLLVTRGSTEQK